ncbi:MAG: ATP-binding protein [Bacteroidota bacterium]
MEGNFKRRGPELVHKREGITKEQLLLENAALQEELVRRERTDLALIASHAVAEIGSWEYHLQNDAFSLSEDVYQIFELPYQRDIDAEGFVGIFHPEDRGLVMQMIDRAIKRELPFKVEARIVPQLGTIKWVHIRGGAIQDELGQIHLVSGTIHDITERKIVEREQYRRNQVLEALASGASQIYVLSLISRMLEDFLVDGFVGVWGWDEEAEKLFWQAGPNMPPRYLDAAKNMPIEVPPMELIGLNYTTPFYAKISQLEASPLYEELSAEIGIKRVFLIPILNESNGKLGLLSVYFMDDMEVLPTYMRNLVRTAAQLVAITLGRQRAEQEISYRREFEKLIAQVSTDFVRISADEVFEAIDDALARIGKFARVDRSYIFSVSEDGQYFSNTHEWCGDEIEPQIQFLQDIPLSSFPWGGELLKDTFRVEDVSALPKEAEAERDFLAMQGIQSVLIVPMFIEKRWIGFMGFDSVKKRRLFTSEDETLLQLVGQVFANAIKRQEIELALKDANISLEQKVNQRTAALLHSNRSLERFAYMASHDMKEPLRMVISYLQLLEMRSGNALQGDNKEYLDFAVDGAQRMNQLLEAILTYSSLNIKGKPFEEINLEEVIQGVLKNLEFTIHSKQAEIIRPTLPSLEADKFQLIQLFQNLISNALKFQQAGNKPEIFIRVKDQGESYLFSIEDNGIGIPENYQSKIFQVFQRLHARDEYPGSGVGLSICREIVRRHGGKIWVQSLPGQGTTFFFTLNKNAQPDLILDTSDFIA